MFTNCLKLFGFEFKGPIRWPLVGNMPEIAFLNAKYPHLAMETLAEKYGDVMRLGFGVHEACSY